jgi:hypothetical protein
MREIAQKDFSFTFGPITDPVAEIEPGEVITVAVPDRCGAAGNIARPRYLPRKGILLDGPLSFWKSSEGYTHSSRPTPSRSVIVSAL